jgi:hypothetical protein
VEKQISRTNNTSIGRVRWMDVGWQPKPWQGSLEEEATVSKAKTKRSIAALIKAATKAAEELNGEKANWIHVDTKDDHSGVILTTVIAGKPLARITFNGEQLDELIVLLESSRKELQAKLRLPKRRSRKSS